MWRWIPLLVLALGGCALESAGTQFVAPVVSPRNTSTPEQVQRDERECAVYADARPSEIRYAAYVACLVSRGHRTYASLLGHDGATGVTVLAQRGQPTRQVYRDLTNCAEEMRARVDMPPHPDFFTGPASSVATQRIQAPFAQCMDRAGYATTLHATPTAAMVTAVVASTPVQAPPATPPPTVVPPPPSPPAAPPAVAAVPPPPSGAPGRVKLGLYIDPATQPPVVTVVVSDTPAGRAGLRAGDVVLGIDGRSIRSEADIAAALALKRPGDLVRMDIRRGGQRMTLEATLGAQ